MSTPSSSLKKMTSLRILYLDDKPSDLENFRSNVKKNREYWNIDLVTKEDCNEVIEILKKENFDVFVCDHNMPVQMGFSLIKYLQTEDPDILYVLYTGAGNLDEDLKISCQMHDVLYFFKTEEFTTLIEQIINKLKGVEASSEDEIYLFISETLIKDLRRIEAIDPQFRMTIDDKTYTPEKIIAALICHFGIVG